MAPENDIHILLEAQRALLGAITPTIRQISVDIDPLKYKAKFRVHFDGEPHEVIRENVSVAWTEIISSFSNISSWEFNEEFLVTPYPDLAQPLRLLVYARCENPEFLPPA